MRLDDTRSKNAGVKQIKDKDFLHCKAMFVSQWNIVNVSNVETEKKVIIMAEKHLRTVIYHSEALLTNYMTSPLRDRALTSI